MKNENSCKQFGHNFVQLGKSNDTNPQIFCTKCGEVRKIANAK